MSSFRLMRAVFEVPDRVTQEISLAVSARARAQATISDSNIPARGGTSRLPSLVNLGTFFMEFWNMKQRGELTPEEPPAVWAVLMRAIEPLHAVRLLLANCVGALNYVDPDRPGLKKLCACIQTYQAAPQLSLRGIGKLRTKLTHHLIQAVSIPIEEQTAHILDPRDAHLLLSACEAAVVAGVEDEKRWAQNR